MEVTDLKTKEAYRIDLPDNGWMNGILELGTWEKASLEIQIMSKMAEERNVSCALLSLQDFAASEPDYFDNYTMSRKNASLKITLEGADEDDCLFLPLYRDNGWRCSVNGQKEEIEELADFLMLIPLQAGKNEIILSYAPPGFIPGIWITAMGMILLIIICKYRGKKEYLALNRTLWVLDESVFAILMFIFYAAPFVCLVVKVIGML